MTLATIAAGFGSIEWPVVVWPLLFGFGAYLVITSQPIGKPKPDLAERLRRLDVDERLREQVTETNVRPVFASRLLEAILRPVLDDAGRALRGVFARFGIAGGADLERKLRIARPGVSPSQLFGEKLGTAVVGLAIFPIMNVIGIHPFGPWPAWAWLGAGVLGFLSPDFQLDQQLATRRTKCLMELPTLIDMVSIATSAGLALEQAVKLVTQESSGMVALELQRAYREAELGQRTLVEALSSMAQRNEIPELTSFVGQLRASHEQGIPMAQALAVQAEALREQKRLKIVEAGGKASVRMVLPVALFIFPVLFVVLLVPAGVQLLRITG